VDFVVSFSAGLLGIVAGLSMDGALERAKDNRTKEDFLALMRNELIEIRGRIPPQTKTPLVLSQLTKIPLMLYPEVWDSFVASGLMRLLSAEQVTKLSSVYKFVKATQYDAEWVRQNVEEFESLPDKMKAEKEILNRRYKFLQESYDRRGEQLTKDIDKLLEETWWS
jgi:hypothetical protein